MKDGRQNAGEITNKLGDLGLDEEDDKPPQPNKSWRSQRVISGLGSVLQQLKTLEQSQDHEQGKEQNQGGDSRQNEIPDSARDGNEDNGAGNPDKGSETPDKGAGNPDKGAGYSGGTGNSDEDDEGRENQPGGDDSDDEPPDEIKAIDQ